MTTVPLTQWTVAEATEAQFRLVDAFHREFDGYEALEAGDYGAPADLGRSRMTAKVERVLATFFGAEDVVLTPGAGTGALRSALMASLALGASVLVHDFPVYATTAVTFRAMGRQVATCDFNDARAAPARPSQQRPDMLYVQHARQRFDDGYSAAEVIAAARDARPATRVLVDDNYTALAVPRIGTQLGADLSAFSLFKLLGEPGVGCVAGDARLIDRIRPDNYSGGTKIHGPVAIATLKAPRLRAGRAGDPGRGETEVVQAPQRRRRPRHRPGVRREPPGARRAGRVRPADRRPGGRGGVPVRSGAVPRRLAVAGRGERDDLPAVAGDVRGRPGDGRADGPRTAVPGRPRHARPHPVRYGGRGQTADPGRSSDPGKDEMIKVVVTGMGKERIAQLVQETGAGLVEAKAKTDFEARPPSSRARPTTTSARARAAPAVRSASRTRSSAPAEVVRLSGVGTTADPADVRARPWTVGQARLRPSATARSTPSCPARCLVGRELAAHPEAAP